MQKGCKSAAEHTEPLDGLSSDFAKLEKLLQGLILGQQGASMILKACWVLCRAVTAGQGPVQQAAVCGDKCLWQGVL